MSSSLRPCTKCKQLLPLSSFGKDLTVKDGLRRWCLACSSQHNREWRAKNKELLREKNKQKYRDNWDKVRGYQRDHYQRLKKKVFDHYGWQCVCCGEDNPFFLTLDHINNDGGEHRKQIGSSSGIGGGLYNWAIKNNFPPTLRTLCYNCNCGRQRNGGVCPHQEAPLWEGVEGASSG